MSACGYCSAKVWWAETEAGRSILVNAEPDPDGNVIVLRDGLGPVVQVLTVAQEQRLLADLGPRYTSHFATCPKSYRKPR